MDEDGNVFIKGRSKNMLLGSNGQNIYPEEIEDKLNSMPLVAECLVIQSGEKLIALVHPDYDEAQNLGLNAEDLQKIMDENRIQLNTIVPAYCNVFKKMSLRKRQRSLSSDSYTRNNFLIYYNSEDINLLLSSIFMLL